MYLRNFIHYTSTNIFGMIGLSCYILADTYFVAQGLGADGLAALNLSIPIYNIIHGTGLMLGIGGAARYSMASINPDDAAKDPSFTQSLFHSVPFVVLFMLLGLFFSGSIARLFGANAQTIIMSRTYLQVLLLFSPAYILNDILLCFVRNDGAPQHSMLAMLTGSFSNILLDYLFIFPMDMGIFGAALATGLAPIISISVLWPYFICKKNHFHFIRILPFIRNLNPRILSIGFSSFVTEVAAGLIIIIFNTMFQKLEGTLGVAAYGIIANIALVITAIYSGIAQGIQPLLSQCYGQQDSIGIKQILRYSTILVISLSVIIYFILLVNDSRIISCFNSEKLFELQNLARKGLRIYFTGIAAAGLNIVFTAALAATDHPKTAGILSLLRGGILIIPISLIMVWLFNTIGLWLTFPLVEILVLILIRILAAAA